MRKSNGVECMYPTDPLDGLSLDQMLDTSALVYCGDAQPLGGGGFFGSEYWSNKNLHKFGYCSEVGSQAAKQIIGNTLYTGIYIYT